MAIGAKFRDNQFTQPMDQFMRSARVLVLVVLTACSSTSADGLDLPLDTSVDVSDTQTDEPVCTIVDCNCRCLDDSYNFWGGGGCGDADYVGICENDCRKNCPRIDLPDCRTYPLPTASACIMNRAARVQQIPNGFIEGQVLAAGRGPPPDSCRQSTTAIQFGTEFVEGNDVWFELRDSGGSVWLVEVAVAGARVLSVGDNVSVAVNTSLLVVTGPEGHPYVWLTHSTNIDGNLNLPLGFRTLVRGSRACYSSGNCRNWAGHDVYVYATEYGHDTLVGLGGTAQVNGVTVINVRLFVDVATTADPCVEASAADVMMAFVWP